MIIIFFFKFSPTNGHQIEYWKPEEFNWRRAIILLKTLNWGEALNLQSHSTHAQRWGAIIIHSLMRNFNLIFSNHLYCLQSKNLEGLAKRRRQQRSSQVFRVIHSKKNYKLRFFLLSPYFDPLDFSTFTIILYVCVAIIVISAMLFFLISYSFSRQKVSFVWPVFM